MGLTLVDVRVANLQDPNRWVEDQFLVDSGATHTVLPESIWKPLSIESVGTVTIRFADGRRAIRSVGFAIITYEKNSVPTRVILGESDDSRLLGVVTLEEMGLALDPLKRTLTAMEIRM